MVYLYTDGSSRGNPGPGGFGTILKYGQHEKIISEGYKLTTNNRMELMAVIRGLEALTRGPMDVLVVSDSKYVVESVEKKWVFNWQKKGFKDNFYNQIFSTYLICNAFWILVIRANFSNRCAYLSWFLMRVVIIYPYLRKRFYVKQEIVIAKVLTAYFMFTYLMYLVYYSE